MKPQLVNAEEEALSAVLAAGKGNPERRRPLKSLPAADPAVSVADDIDTEPVAAIPAAAPSITAPEQAPATTSTRPRRATRRKMPNWRDLATRPRKQGEAVNVHRLNIPCSEGLVHLLNQRDRELLQSGSPWPINRSLLLDTAIDMLASDQETWIQEWQQARDSEPASTTTLQGRISEARKQSLPLLRYTTDGRVHNTGPVLAFIVRSILDQDTPAD